MQLNKLELWKHGIAGWCGAARMRFAMVENAGAVTLRIGPRASAGRELRKGRVIPLESDVIKRERERMPTGFWIRFHADHVRLRDHAD